MQNYTTEATSPKTLKINTTVQLTDIVEAEISLPYFCKDSDGSYYFFESPEKCTSLKQYTGLCQVQISYGKSDWFLRQIAKDFKNIEVIPEEEFTNLLTYAVTGLMTPAA
jgi:hypothetical protein